MKKIEEYVRSIPDFPEKGIIFRDVTSVLQDADGLTLAIDSMKELLKDVDFDIMKLDLKFFQSNDKKAQIIIKAVLNMAKELKIPVVAEGVENKEHLMILRKFGCDYAQGFFYSKPLPKDKFDELLER